MILKIVLSTLIDENTDAIALQWDKGFTKFWFIYRQLRNETDDNDTIIFDKIKEVIFLLKYLEDERFIYVFENKDITKDNCLYNTAEYREDDGTYHLKKKVIETNGENFRAVGYFFSNCKEIPCDFGKLVQHFGNGIFHVAGSLRELVEHDFRTSEQIRHEQAMGEAQDQVKYSRWAFFGSIAALIVSLFFGIWQKCSETKIDQSQINQIKQTIEQTTLPEVFKTEITNDTLITKVVQMPKVKQTNQ